MRIWSENSVLLAQPPAIPLSEIPEVNYSQFTIFLPVDKDLSLQHAQTSTKI